MLSIHMPTQKIMFIILRNIRLFHHNRNLNILGQYYLINYNQLKTRNSYSEKKLITTKIYEIILLDVIFLSLPSCWHSKLLIMVFYWHFKKCF